MQHTIKYICMRPIKALFASVIDLCILPAVTDLNFIETDTQWSDYDFLSSFDEFLNNKYYNVVLYRIMNKIQSNQKKHHKI